MKSSSFLQLQHQSQPQALSKNKTHTINNRLLYREPILRISWGTGPVLDIKRERRFLMKIQNSKQIPSGQPTNPHKLNTSLSLSFLIHILAFLYINTLSLYIYIHVNISLIQPHEETHLFSLREKEIDQANKERRVLLKCQRRYSFRDLPPPQKQPTPP